MPTNFNATNADVNGDGRITASDVTLLLQSFMQVSVTKKKGCKFAASEVILAN
jgi:hypothetical protein